MHVKLCELLVNKNSYTGVDDDDVILKIVL